MIDELNFNDVLEEIGEKQKSTNVVENKQKEVTDVVTSTPKEEDEYDRLEREAYKPVVQENVIIPESLLKKLADKRKVNNSAPTEEVKPVIEEVKPVTEELKPVTEELKPTEDNKAKPVFYDMEDCFEELDDEIEFYDTPYSDVSILEKPTNEETDVHKEEVEAVKEVEKVEDKEENTTNINLNLDSVVENEDNQRDNISDVIAILKDDVTFETSETDYTDLETGGVVKNYKESDVIEYPNITLCSSTSPQYHIIKVIAGLKELDSLIEDTNMYYLYLDVAGVTVKIGKVRNTKLKTILTSKVFDFFDKKEIYLDANTKVEGEMMLALCVIPEVQLED